MSLSGTGGTPMETAREREEALPGKLRWVLLAAFLGLLAIGLLSGSAALRALAEMHAQEQTVRHALAARTQSLGGLCLSIQIYNETLQQYVSSPGAEPDELMRGQMARLAETIRSGVRNYPGGHEAEEVRFLRAIDDLLARQRRLLDPILALGPEARRREAPQLLAGQILPLHTRILEESERLSVWNGRQIQESDQVLLAEFSRLEGSLRQSLLVALGSGLALVLASMLYILRLERQRRRRYQELARSREELHGLSSRLVDAQETERRSISRELHDEVGQSLGALLVDLGRMSANPPGDPAELQNQFGRMKAVAERTVETVRNMALLLRPSMLDDLGTRRQAGG
jgi:signal transduction histidine kinase